MAASGALALGRRRYCRRARGSFLPLLLIPTLIFLGGSTAYHLTDATQRTQSPGGFVVNATSSVASAVTDGAATISSGGQLLYALNGFIWRVDPAGGDPVDLTQTLRSARTQPAQRWRRMASRWRSCLHDYRPQVLPRQPPPG